MPNSYFNTTGYPSPNSAGASAPMRDILSQIAGGFDKLPTLAGNNGRMVFINSGGTALEGRTSIDGIAIGAVTPATGAFTTLTATTSLGVNIATPLSVLHVVDEIRVSRASVPTQYGLLTNTASALFLYGFSSPTNAKQIILDSTTDVANTAPSAGAIGIQFRTLGAQRALIDGNGLSVTGAISSSGSATISGDLVLSGSGLIRSDVATASNALSGGSSSSNGASVLVYGGSHATLANRGYLRSGSTNILEWNASGGVLTGTLDVSGAVSLSSGTSSGIVQHGSSTGAVFYSGGSSGANGGNIVMWGGSHATTPNTGRIRAGSTTVADWAAGSFDVTGAISASTSVLATTRLVCNSSGAIPSIGASGDGVFARSSSDGVIYLGTVSDQFIRFNGGTYSFGSGGSVTLGAGTTISDGATIAGVDIGYRNIPTLGNTATAAASAVGKVYTNTGNLTINNSVFAPGDVVCVYNNSAADISIVAGTISTMRLAGTSLTGTRTLAQRGFASIFFVTASQCIVSGAGVS